MPAVRCSLIAVALVAVLLEVRLGIVAANYDGSLWEWSSRDDLPLETGR